MSSTTNMSESKHEENIAEEKVPDIPSSSEDGEVETEAEILTDVDSTVSEDYVGIDDETRTTVECQTTSQAGLVCGICYTDLHLGNSVSTICGHKFCKPCISNWLNINPTCPLCRISVLKNNVLNFNIVTY